MSPTRDTLLIAIRQNPDDDAPRIALADWLEANGEADFAAFIRTELERDRLPKNDPQWKSLDQRARAFWKKVPADLKVAGALTMTRRGLPHYVMTSLLALRDGIDRLGPYAPRLRVLLDGNAGEVQQAEEGLAKGGPDEVGVAFRSLFASPWVREWVELEMQHLRITAERMRAMTGPGNLTGLEVLLVSDCIDDEALRVLCSAELPRLHYLGIHEVMRRTGWDDPLLTSDVVQILVHSPLLARLDYLSLFGEWLRDFELQALANCPKAAGLRSLYLWPKRDSWAGLQAIVQSPHLAGLTWLNLSRIHLTPEFVKLLARSETLPKLTRLDIDEDEPAEHRELLARRFGKGLIAGPIEDDLGGG